MDQLYRHFHHHADESQQATLLDDIRKEVERRYTNDYLLCLGDRFQQSWESVVELSSEKAGSAWPPPMDSRNDQRCFFGQHVAPVLSRGKKLFVIVSDALRYEVGEELHQRILREDRFRSTLGHLVACLPSYTQLGMAALLPQQSLEIEPASGEVKADGIRTAGLEARRAILARNGRKATALKARDFLSMNAKEEGRALFRDHDLIYIFENSIDHVGDKRETETEVFQAATKVQDTLIALLKKIAAVNGTNVLITADHGFLFQRNPPDESDYTRTPEDGVQHRNSRFVIGSGLLAMDGSLVLPAKAVGLEGDYSVAIPKSVNRYRVRGSGSRYVHGGATLQETVVPLLTINKARSSDTERVDVDVIRTGSNWITTTQALVTFYQEEPAREKQLGRTLRIGFYAKDDELLSDIKEITFDSDEEDPRLRERKLAFVFSKKADDTKYRNGEVILRLEEKIIGSNQFRIYNEFVYRLKKAFETDFEF